MFRYFLFFFSSRRRHTRCSRDWSSDVCSSDLPGELKHLSTPRKRKQRCESLSSGERNGISPNFCGVKAWWRCHRGVVGPIRSEERRVGKECRSRWSREQVKKKKEREHMR